MPVLAQDLRDAVLQAAMEGKLTEQLESDSSVDKLLNEIATEKERLVKEKIIKKEKKLAPITEDEIPFDIPDNWKWEKLGLITITNIGLTYKPQNISNSGTLVLRSSNIQNGKMSYLDNVYVSMKIPESAKISKGDVLICVRNGSKKLVGKAAIVDRDGMAFGAFMAKIHSKWINSNYIKYYVESHVFRGSLDNVKTETINQITQTMLKNKIIPIPPIEEQQRIVDKLNKIMPLIDEYEKLEKQLVELKKEFPGDMKAAILQAAMEGKLTEQLKTDKKIELHSTFRTNNEERLNIPREWDWFNLKDLLSIRTGKKDQNFATEDGTYNFYTCAKEVFKAPSYSFEGESLILPGNGANVGKVTLYNGKFEAYQRTYVLQSLNYDVNMKFMYYCLLENWNEYNRNKMYGSAIPYIKLKNLQNYPIPLPPIEEQQRIVDKLDKIIPLIDELKGVENDKY